MAQDDILRKASKKLGELVSENEKARLQPEQDRRDFISTLAREMVKTLSPLIAGLTMQSKQDREDLMKAIASIDVKVPPIPSPKVNIPQINVPTPKVTVNPPQVKVPQINVPKTTINMPDIMDVRMAGVNNKAPMPVIMMDTKGKPMPLSMGAGGGGKADFIRIKDILTSTGASLINDAGQLRTDAGTPTISQDYGSGEIGSQTVRTVQATDAIASVNIVSGSASGTEYTEGETAGPGDGGLIMARDADGSIYGVRQGSGTSETALRVAFATDAVASVSVNDAFRTTVASNLINSDDRLRVSVETGGSGLTDAELRASSVPVAQASGAIWSTNVVGFTASVAATLQNPDGTTYDSDNPLPATLYDGAGNDIDITAQGVDAMANTNNELVSAARLYGFNNSSWDRVRVDEGTAETAIRVVHASDAVSSTNLATALASEIDSVDVKQISGAVFSTVVNSGNITARPVQVRGSLATAYVTLTDSSEDTFLAATAGSFHDLIWVTAANESDSAVNLSFRSVTGGNVVLNLEIPANATAGISQTVPYPQDATGNNWTVQNTEADVSNTTVNVTGLFSIET